MDAWAWTAIEPWLADHLQLPVGPLFCVIDGPTRGRAWSARAARVEVGLLAARAGVRRGRVTSCSATTPPLRCRARASQRPGVGSGGAETPALGH
jgi:hypothetical protein